MSYGFGGGWPFEFGGGDSTAEEILVALRAALGNVPPPEGGIDDLWRKGEAIVIDCANSLVEVAVAQAFPQLATYGLERWEELLGIIPSGYDEERRQRVVLLEATPPRADFPSLDEELAAISPKLSLVPPTRDRERVGQFGMFFNDDRFLRCMAFSDAYVWRVQYELGTETEIPVAIRREVERVMQDRMDAWETYELVDDGAAFYMDGFNNSRMDQTRIY